MAYKKIPHTFTDENNIQDFIYDIAERKEYYIFKPSEDSEIYDVRGFITPLDMKNYLSPSKEYVNATGLQLSAAQLFVRNFQNPNTEFSRLLINWQTGVGKSIAAISIGNEFIRQYRINALLGEELATVFIIGFTAKETIREDMLKFPEFGFVSKDEVNELRELRQKVFHLDSSDPEIKKLSNLLSIFGRRITDKARGGHYQFYGYKEFANRLFIITQKGAKEKFDVQSLFMPSKSNEDDIFTEIIDKAIKGDYIIINEDLLNNLKNGLIIADEIHNVYNILDKNNYGIAIQYVLDILGDNAPRAVFMSATPMTGSASEVVDLLNLLVPKSYLPKSLKRSDFFYKTTKHIDMNTLQKINNLEQNEFKAILKSNLVKTPPNRSKLIKLAQSKNKGYKDDGNEDNDDNEDNINDDNEDNDDNAKDKNGKNSALYYHNIEKKLQSKKSNDTIMVGNKLLSISQLKEDDFEESIETLFMVSELKKGAIQNISLLSSGRVSFLLDTDLNLYPRRIFIGESYDEIPYLKITKCPMSPLHETTVDYEHFIENTEFIEQSLKKKQSSGFSPKAYSLYDCVFPNMDNTEHSISKKVKQKIGLYKSIETPLKLLQAPEKWKSEIGVSVDYGSNRGLLTNTLIIGGSYLHKSNLAKYSTKYHALILETIKAIKNGSGKIMIYHHRVKMSGVLFIGEILRENGFIESGIEPTDNTRCAICGIARKKHAKNSHTFTPARFIVAHSDIDKTSMMKNIHQFNSINNIDGYQYRIILGSKIIREGLNFFAVRYQFITSLPTDYPTLVQVFGRVIRKGSHLSLPPDQRDVTIQIFISTRSDNLTSPELQRYINKGREYLVIQEVEKALRTNAVDAFANYEKVKQALPIAKDGSIIPSLDAIPYKPIAIKEINPNKLKTSTFYAYGYSDREVYVIAYMLRILFDNRPVWTYDDLWHAVKTGQVGNINYNHTLFNKDNFVIALHLLLRPSGSPPKIVTEIGKYFIQSTIKSDKRPNVDIESFIRNEFKPKENIKIKISNYLSKNQTNKNFNIYIDIFVKNYINSEHIELSLIELNSIFHITLMKKIITDEIRNDKAIKISENDIKQILNMYKRYKLILTSKDIPNNIIKESNHSFIMGYKDKNSVHLYFKNNEWKTISHHDAKIENNTKENNIVIGFTSDDKGIYSKFKTRAPMQKIVIAQDKKNDIRSLAKGAICETRIREDLFFQVQELKLILKKLNKDKIISFSEKESSIAKKIDKPKKKTLKMTKTITFYKKGKSTNVENDDIENVDNENNDDIDDIKDDDVENNEYENNEDENIDDIEDENNDDNDDDVENNDNENNDDENNGDDKDIGDDVENKSVEDIDDENNKDDSEDADSNKILLKKIKYASKQFDDIKYPSTKILCHSLKLLLLLLEEYSRFNNNTKWLYLFDNQQPTISLV